MPRGSGCDTRGPGLGQPGQLFHSNAFSSGAPDGHPQETAGTQDEEWACFVSLCPLGVWMKKKGVTLACQAEVSGIDLNGLTQLSLGIAAVSPLTR
uniref:Uncharacterized protein n=1 Tax=Knipowitschia caucasica TaxID=637954 RepID=A0AAV2KWY3_KNICA